MTHTFDRQATSIPRSVGAAAGAVVAVRGRPERLKRLFDESSVPMVLVDDSRRYVEVNRPARLAFRLSLDELRGYSIDDLTPPHMIEAMERTWSRLLEVGCGAGRHEIAAPDGTRFEIVYCAQANVLPGVHLGAFAPAHWPEDELGVVADRGSDDLASLTPRETSSRRLPPRGSMGPRTLTS